MRQRILAATLLCAALAIPAGAAALHDARGGYLGVHLAASKDGVLVTAVMHGSPAEKAGLEAGDRIVAVDGRSVATEKDLREALHGLDAGKKVTVEIKRDGDRKRLDATLGERKDLRALAESYALNLPEGIHATPLPEGYLSQLEREGGLATTVRARPRLGVSILPLTDELREHFGVEKGRGVLVSAIVKGSPAERAGLKAGDVIVAVGGSPVDEAGDIGRVLKKGESVDVEVIRDRGRATFTASIEE
jgi:serine protease Do